MLGTATVADGETFRQAFVVPTAAPPGSYQVRATSAEGEVLTVELAVEAQAATTEAAAAGEPTAALMQLNRMKSVGELSAIVIGLLASAGLGLALVYGGRQTTPPSSQPAQANSRRRQQ